MFCNILLLWYPTFYGFCFGGYGRWGIASSHYSIKLSWYVGFIYIYTKKKELSSLNPFQIFTHGIEWSHINRHFFELWLVTKYIKLSCWMDGCDQCGYTWPQRNRILSNKTEKHNWTSGWWITIKAYLLAQRNPKIIYIN